jgi:putative inorganic carbon (hco3(-)) transporter
VSTAYVVRHFSMIDLLAQIVKLSFTALHAMIIVPTLLFVATMGLMLFHPPDFHFHSIDRIAFALLIFVVVLRVCVLRLPIQVAGLVTWPMLALLILAFADAITQPYETETWSLFAAKWLVPFVLYQLAALLFVEAQSHRHFEILALIVLAYLSVIAILFMVNAKQLIFPRYILDEGLGYHPDRARGPFLQAVANGVTLNLLGLIALDSYRRKYLRGWVALCFFMAVPLAIVATKTRAVWLSFAGSVAFLLFFSPSRRVRRACLCLTLLGGIGLGAMMTLSDRNTPLSDRLQERSPVKFRMEIYEAGWEMFLKKPLSGWGSVAMTDELNRRISDFHQENFYFHNTFLEILVQYGLIGLALYLWLVLDLFRIGRRVNPMNVVNAGFLDAQFRSLWPLFVGVYLTNAMLVVMNYQFVNGLLFTVAGMLVAQNRQAQKEQVHVLAA